MPGLTVKALAEFIEKPIADQMRILATQKHPRAEPAIYRITYYHRSRLAIRRYFQKDNDPGVIRTAIDQIQRSGRPLHYIENNTRVLETFLSHPFAERQLAPQDFATQRLTIHDVDIKLTPELVATEGESRKFVFFNMTIAPADPDLARRTLELAWWILRETGHEVEPGDLEFLDLQTATLHVTRAQPRKRTLKRAIQNAQIIAQLWPII